VGCARRRGLVAWVQVLGDELAVALVGPSAVQDEQLEQFGRVDRPHDVGGLADRDAGAEMAGRGQAGRVDGHPRQAGGADLLEGGGDFGVAGGIPGELEDREDPRADLGGEGPPRGEDAARVRLGVTDVVGALLGGYRRSSCSAVVTN